MLAGALFLEEIMGRQDANFIEKLKGECDFPRHWEDRSVEDEGRSCCSLGEETNPGSKINNLFKLHLQGQVTQRGKCVR